MLLEQQFRVHLSQRLLERYKTVDQFDQGNKSQSAYLLQTGTIRQAQNQSRAREEVVDAYREQIPKKPVSWNFLDGQTCPPKADHVI